MPSFYNHLLALTFRQKDGAPKPASPPLSPSVVTLAGLPTEILHSIAHRLPISSAAVLPLVNKHFLHIYGMQAWESLKHDITQRRVFLYLLERDLPDYYADLQLTKKIPASSPSNYVKDSRQHYPSTGRGFFLNYDRFGYAVVWPHVVLALKRNAYGGHHGIPLEAFTYETTRRYTPKPWYRNFEEYVQWGQLASYGQPVQFGTLARIVSGHLLLRCTYRVFEKRVHVHVQTLKALGLEVCNHLSTTRQSAPWYDNSLAKAFQAKKYTEHKEKPSHRSPAPVYIRGKDDAPEADNIDQLLDPSTSMDEYGRCSYCFTEFKVTVIKPSPQSDGEVIIVAWHDLGNGKSESEPWDASNAMWKALVGGEEKYHCEVQSFSVGSIREAFEGRDGLRLI